MAGRTDFPPTIWFPLLFMMLSKHGKLSNFNQINTRFSQFMTIAQNTTYSRLHSYLSAVSHNFFISVQYKKYKEGSFINYDTTTRAIQLPQIVKGQRAGWFALAGRRLPKPDLGAVATSKETHLVFTKKVTNALYNRFGRFFIQIQIKSECMMLCSSIHEILVLKSL